MKLRNGQVTMICLTAVIVVSILTRQTDWIGTVIVLALIFWLFVHD